MHNDPRQERIAERIQLIISDMLLRQVRDPRLAGITVTEVTIDRELQHANVFVNALGDDERAEEVMAGLESASGFIRREVAQGLQLRSAPNIHFNWDPRLAYIEEVSELLDQLNIPPAEAVPEINIAAAQEAKSAGKEDFDDNFGDEDFSEEDFSEEDFDEEE